MDARSGGSRISQKGRGANPKVGFLTFHFSQCFPQYSMKMKTIG